MKLLSLVLYRWNEESSVELQSCFELGNFSFFHKGPIKEHIKFHSRLCANRTPSRRRQAVEFDQNLGRCHTWVHPAGIAAAVLVDAEYPQRVACMLISESVRIFLEAAAGQWENVAQDKDFAITAIQELFAKFQNPVEADQLTKIENDLAEVKETVMQSMDELLKRGESLDVLMQKSKDLSSTSVRFHHMAKKNNQCCKAY